MAKADGVVDGFLYSLKDTANEIYYALGPYGTASATALGVGATIVAYSQWDRRREIERRVRMQKNPYRDEHERITDPETSYRQIKERMTVGRFATELSLLDDEDGFEEALRQHPATQFDSIPDDTPLSGTERPQWLEDRFNDDEI